MNMEFLRIFLQNSLPNIFNVRFYNYTIVVNNVIDTPLLNAPPPEKLI